MHVGVTHLLHALRPLRLGELAHRVAARIVATARTAVRWIAARPPEVWAGAVMAATLGLFLLILFTGSTGVGRGGR